MTPEEQRRIEAGQEERTSLLLRKERDAFVDNAMQRLQQASSIAPDTYAQAERVSETTTIPPLTLAQSPVSLEAYQSEQEQRTLLQNSPKLTQWLEDVDNAALSQDELDVLSRYEAMNVSGGEADFVEGLQSAKVGGQQMVEGWKAFASSQSVIRIENTLQFFDEIDSSSPEEHAELVSAWNEAVSEGADSGLILRYAGANAEEKQQIRAEIVGELANDEEAILSAAQAIVAYQQQMPEGEEFSWDNFGDWAQQTTGSGLPYLLGFLALAATTGGMGVVAGGSALFVGESTSSALLEGEDITDEDYNTRLLRGALVAGGLEATLGPVARVLGKPLKGIPTDLWEQAARGVLSRTGRAVTADAIEEASQEVLQQMLQEWAINGELEWTEESLSQYLEAAAAGALLGGPTGGVIALPSAAAQQRREAEAAAAEAAAGDIEGINDLVTDTRMRDRSPRKFRQFLQRGGFDQRSIYIDGTVLRDTVGEDASLLRLLQLSQSEVEAAADSGNRVAVNLAAYMENVPARVPTLEQAFVDHGTLQADRMSRSEGRVRRTPKWRAANVRPKRKRSRHAPRRRKMSATPCRRRFVSS